jgi:phospholipid/cholesterol/gamma-HCH transport system substrate-binding protein
MVAVNLARGATVRRRLAGVVFLVVPALLVWLAVAVYDKRFTDSAPVVVETGSVGNEMHLGAEVKLRGVVVGEVREIDATDDGARLTLALRPNILARIPADVRAQMLPTTLSANASSRWCRPRRRPRDRWPRVPSSRRTAPRTPSNSSRSSTTCCPC